MVKLSLAEARRRRHHAQLLGGAAKSPVDALRRTAFARTLGGVDVYVGLRARNARAALGTVTTAVDAGDLRVVPAVRGCIYLVAADQAPWALRQADLASARRRARESERAGIRAGELARVGEAVVEVLAEGPRSTAAIRRSLPRGVHRSLGDAGRRVGWSSTLPPALRELELLRRIERRPADGRLDHESYEWRTVEPRRHEADEAPSREVHRWLGHLYFTAAALATIDAFTWWMGIGKREARRVIDSLGLVAVAVEGFDDDFLALPEVVEAATPEATGRPALLPFADNLLHLQDGARLHVDPALWSIEVPMFGRGRRAPLGSTAKVSFRSIVIDGEIVGFWEFNPESGRVVTATPRDLERDQVTAVDDEADSLSTFLGKEIGHGRSFSLDTDDALRQRVSLLPGRAA
jgi:hypothetical protein